MISEFDLDLKNCPPYLLARCWYFRGVRKERFNCIISAFVFNKNSKTLGPHVLGKKPRWKNLNLNSVRRGKKKAKDSLRFTLHDKVAPQLCISVFRKRLE